MMVLFFFSKQKTAYERRISDWSSDVCSSDLSSCSTSAAAMPTGMHTWPSMQAEQFGASGGKGTRFCMIYLDAAQALYASQRLATNNDESLLRSEEHTSELQSLMRISYAVFCLKKQNKKKTSIR